MKTPPIEVFTRHLTQIPDVFLQSPLQGGHGKVAVWAVVADLLFDKRKKLLSESNYKHFSKPGARDKNYLKQVLVCCWLFHHPYLQQHDFDGNKILSFLKDGLKKLAKLVAAEQFVSDTDRREELVRLVFKLLEITVDGETPQQAEDRLKALDSVERDRIIRHTKKQREHARKVKAALEAQRAAEAASRYSRE